MPDICARLGSSFPMNSESVNEKQFITAEVISVGSKVVGSINSNEEHVSASVGAKKSQSIVGNVQLAGPQSPSESTGVSDHALLTGRDKTDQHPIEAITGLRPALDKMVSDIKLKADGMEVDSKGLVYLLSGNERIAGPFGPFGTGTGGSTNAAKLTVTNTTGWLFTTVADGRPCTVSLNWSSLLDGISTGKGQLQVYVAESLKTIFSIEQGDVSVDVSGWLSSGNNSVRLAVTDAYGNVQSLIFTIEVVTLILKSAFDGSPAYSGEINYYYIPVGAAQKTVHFLLDGEEIGTEVVTVSNQQQDFIIPAQSHGSHTFEVYFTARIGDIDVESNSLYYDLIFYEEGRTETVIASVFRPSAIEQFDTFVIPYRVYNPLSLTAKVVLDEAGTNLKELTVDRTEQQWSHRIDDIGDTELTITSGGTVKRFVVTVVESSVKVTPVTNNLVLDLSSYGRSNLEPDPLTWESKGIECGFSGFNLKSDGWVLDDDGVTVMRVGGDARLTIPLKIFETDFRTTGKTIEIEFATRSVIDYDAVLLTCWSGGRGITIDAQKTLFKSAQSEVSVPYKEEEHIRITFTIEKRTGNRLVLVYVNGIMSGAVQYPADDDFTQTEPVGISIGSNDCTMDIYHIRVYDNDLTRQQVLNNWIADTQIGALRKERYSRNQVYDEYGRITTETISRNLQYLILRSPVLPQYKGDKKTINDQFVDSVNTARGYKSEGTQIDVQGTSSQYYYRKNYKLKYKKGFIMGTTVVEVYAMNDDAVPVAVFTMKADVASSEGYYNVCTARLFNRFHPFKMPAQVADPRTRYSIDGFPIAIFWDNGNETVFLGKYNFNNDKGSPEPFGLSGKDERWEVLQNGTPLVGFHSADFSGNWEEDLEGNYPDGNTDLTNLKPMWEWVASTKGDPDKFDSELSAYFVPEAVDYYMIFTEAFLCMDQREKNVLWRFIDSLKKWLADYYDADSVIGHNNQAQPVFDYWMEDIDYTADGEPVYNGQNSVFWKNMRTARAEKLKAEWHRLRDAGFSYETVMEEFRQHKEHWCEAIYNEDMQIKCLDPLLNSGDGTYLPFLRGDKWAWTQWWLYKRFRYLDSKYEYGDSLINMTTIRTNVMQNMTVTYFMKMYGHVRYNAESVEIRVEKDIPYEFVSKATGAEDRVIGLPDSDMITDIGDMSGHMVELIDTSKLTRIVRLKLGSDTEGYTNRSLTSLTLGNNKLLRYLDVRNCPELKTTIDASGCTGLEEAYFDGTSITGLSLPNGGSLKKLHLPESVVNLTLRNQTALTEFVMPSYRNVSTLWIENVSSVVDPMAILNQTPANSRVRLIGIHIAVDSYQEIVDLIARLDTMRGIDENNLNVATAQVSGTVYLEEVTQPQLNEIAQWQSRYPSLSVMYSRVETYTVRFWVDGVLVVTVSNVAWGTDVIYPGETPTRPETEAAIWEFTDWNPAPVNVVADMDCHAQFRNTIPLIRLLVEGTFAGVDGVFRDDFVTKLAAGSLSSCPNLKQIVVPSLEYPNKSFTGNTLDLVYMPGATRSGQNGDFGSTTAFTKMSRLVLRDYKAIGLRFLAYVQDVTHLIFEGNAVPTLADYTLLNIVDYVYVRADVYDSTIIATNWSSIADRIRKIEDYPEIWTVGMFDGDAVESDVLNDADAASYLRGELTEFVNYDIPKIKAGAFTGQANLTKVVVPKAETAVDSFPNSLRFLDVYQSKGFGKWHLPNKIETLIVRANKVVSLGSSDTGLGSGSTIEQGGGYVYVPKDLVESYKVATNWSAIADQIRAIEDYPEITGGL